MSITRLFLLCSALSLLSGCSFKDIDKRIFVMAIGIDKSNEESKPYRVTLKLALPAPKTEPGGSHTQIVSVNAESIPSAIRLIIAKVPKQLDFSHSSIYILGQSLAFESIQEPLDWLVRRTDIPISGIISMGKPNAEAVLSMNLKSEKSPGSDLYLSFSEEGARSPLTLSEYLYDFYRRTTEKGMDPYLPVIESEKDTHNINKVAVLDKQNVKTILMDPAESRVFHELLNQYPSFDISTKIDEKPLVLAIRKVKRNFKIDTSDENMPVIRVSVHMNGIVEESSVGIYEDNWSRLEKAAERDEAMKYTNLLKKLQKNEVDPLGFGLLYRATRHGGDRDWEEWQAIYPKAKFDVQVKIDIQGTGALK
ncbi:Ger(x)C family spore germination protein [Paenibacillus sp. Soil787]|uniref:Ger(x)C family spore germination protein n=1 Tax=Paenibacillus sp. Soil787 TaxID=1736411 RepID=UPI0006F4AFCF|nr:Ger(x)C family spore germination protein [Paenibacillus sp. Soil787]KRF42996.1 hypothetical protein ASG93_20820 [Paenibacillus sp. Soil787]